MTKETPLIIKNHDKKCKESGCCFRSCGGSPCILRNNSTLGICLKKIVKKIKK